MKCYYLKTSQSLASSGDRELRNISPFLTVETAGDNGKFYLESGTWKMLQPRFKRMLNLNLLRKHIIQLLSTPNALPKEKHKCCRNSFNSNYFERTNYYAILECKKRSERV